MDIIYYHTGKWTTNKQDKDLVTKARSFCDRTRLEMIRTRLEVIGTCLEVTRTSRFPVGQSHSWDQES